MSLRQPIVVLVGHIDHGKSSILERIKGISITKAEPGGITQTIRSYDISLKTIQNICGPLLQRLPIKVTIPGLLFLDSPGHAAFNNMRKRGGNLADLAVLVVDVREGMQEQTRECIKILTQYKTPFVVALNKIDALPGWHSQPERSLHENINSQYSGTKEALDQQLYTLVGKLSEYNFNAERFDKVEDYTKQIAIIPVSAKTTEGIPELLMVIGGLAQKFLEKSLQAGVSGQGKATVLEVKEEPGIGTTLDIVLYEGTLKVNDQVMIGTLGKPIITKVRALFQPEGKKLRPVKEVTAAAGVKVVAPELKEVFGGVPLRIIDKQENIQEIEEDLKKEIEEVVIETDKEGVIAKADTLGSLEVLVHLLKQAGTPIKKATMGEITKKDLLDAETEKNPLYKVILGFNVKSVKENVKVITNNVVYRIIEEYLAWKAELEQKMKSQEQEQITHICKIKLMKGLVFRQKSPAVVGVHIVGGILKTEMLLIKKNGDKASRVKNIQEEGKNIDQAEQGKEVAVSLPEVTVGRQIKEEDTLYSDITEHEFETIKKLKKYLNDSEIEILKEIVLIKRKNNPLWGM